MSYQYDLFVIGAGSGGVRAARMSARFGARVAIAEDRYLGGTCVNAGCIPKKLLVYAAHYAEDFEDARAFGWSGINPEFDWRTLVANKDQEIRRLNGIYRNLLQTAGVEVINGRAVLQDPHTVMVGDRSYTAERILIATGGRPYLPDIPGKEHVITSDAAFHLEQLPKQIIIVGGGYIAVEFAGIFNGLGVETTLLYRGELFLRGFDAETRHFLAEQIRKKGIKLLFNTNLTQVRKAGLEYAVRTTTGEELPADAIMYATGRVPNIENMGIAELGLVLNKKGALVVNADYQTSSPTIYAIGDVTDRYNLTPVATAEGTTFARNQFSTQALRVDYHNIPTCIFSQPNMAMVGLTEEQAREQNLDPVIYKTTFTPLKHTLTKNPEKTFMKLIVDRATDRVLGAHMVGAEAGEIIQGIAIALNTGVTKAQFDATIGIHPTLAEEFVTMREPAAP
ncbi:MAG: glutathione-disulfide reductase [Gammaproteobacteria bacterium]|nr:glutathione-disulfide reductase [Gammaproteobacteria bacterium]